MKKFVGIALTLTCVAASGTLSAVEDGRKPAPQAVGYACVSNPKAAETKVVTMPPPAGFKCPPGQTLLVITKQMQDQVAAAPGVEVPVVGPTGSPDLSSPPGSNPQEIKAPKRKKTQKKFCVPVYGGVYCCYGGGYSDCRIE